MTTISVLKEAILICRDANVTPFIWGHRGLGKSSLVKQIASHNRWGFIDLRCSQLESSDIRGLPDRKDGRTHYLPPADMPIADLSQEGIDDIVRSWGDGIKPQKDLNREFELQKLQPRYPNGILFLDELNRAQDDVLQAAFQLVLDRRVGDYIVPPGWCIVAAGNYMEGYIVSGFSDSAFLDRFCHLTLSGGETTLEEWVSYISDVHGESATNVVEFASQNINHLDGDVAGELGFSVQPSRRSWEAVVRVDKACSNNKYSSTAKMEVVSGLIGRDLAHAYLAYSCPVKPRELIKFGVTNFHDKLINLSRTELSGLMWGLISICKSQINDENISKVCLDFADYMLNNIKDKDVIVAFCRALVSSGDHRQDKQRTAVLTNRKLAGLMSEFSKKAGNKSKTFLDRLIERPQLHSLLSRISWGDDINE